MSAGGLRTDDSLSLAAEGRIVDLTPDQRVLLLERRPDAEGELRRRVTELMDEVRRDGDAALVRMARAFDGVELESLEVPRPRWDDALEAIAPDVRRELHRAARNIETFHRAQRPSDVEVETEPGVRLGRAAVPLSAVGVYAPGGRAAYPSSVLMGVVPARAAGVREVVVCSPPGPSGTPPTEVLAACAIAGATRLFALGGAGAVAALAWGTESVPRVQAIVGPGNRWVTEAKRQVAGELRTDAPAGPSEVLVVAGPGADAGRVAGELVAQAEHDPDAAVAAVTWNRSLLEEIRQALARQVDAAPRREIVARALAARGALLLAASRAEALAFAEGYAAEHLALFTDDPRRDLETQTTAGTVFLGESSTVAFGDYMTGANHVLPTAGMGRSFSGLSTLDFLRFYTWQELSAAGAAGMAEGTARLAEAEGLPGHAAAARARAELGEDRP
ncbi:MAG: histidinol dehydrogenase [Gemmatimonadota bacterium]